MIESLGYRQTASIAAVLSSFGICVLVFADQSTANRWDGIQLFRDVRSGAVHAMENSANVDQSNDEQNRSSEGLNSDGMTNSVAGEADSAPPNLDGRGSEAPTSVGNPAEDANFRVMDPDPRLVSARYQAFVRSDAQALVIINRVPYRLGEKTPVGHLLHIGDAHRIVLRDQHGQLHKLRPGDAVRVTGRAR